MKKIRCGDKKVSITSKLFVKKDNTCGKILVVDGCPHANQKCDSECKNCYGKLIAIDVDEFNETTQDYKTVRTNLRDHFVFNGKRIIAKMDATDYINSCDILSSSDEDKKDDIGSLQSPWFYGDRPDTWRTDCAMCKQKYGEQTPCKNVDKNKENGKPNNFCSEQKQRILKFW